MIRIKMGSELSLCIEGCLTKLALAPGAVTGIVLLTCWVVMLLAGEFVTKEAC